MNDLEKLNKALQLRSNGELKEAINLFNELTSENIDNGEYWFHLGLCYAGTDDQKAYECFKTTIKVEPNVVSAYCNLALASFKCDKLEDAYKVLSEGLKVLPKEFDLMYFRAAILGNMGINSGSLLEFYDTLISSNRVLSEDDFLEHKISEDIAILKTRLREETLKKQLHNNGGFKEYEGRVYTEYTWNLPASLFGEATYLDFGKYTGSSINEIISDNPGYLIWALENVNAFCLSEEIIDMLDSRLSIGDCRQINEFKLTALAISLSES